MEATCGVTDQIVKSSASTLTSALLATLAFMVASLLL
jgi:hypothetical protein